jgi:Ca2+-binding RTX toxin-like protein
LSAIIKTDNIIALKTNDFSDVYSGGMLQPEYIWRYGVQQVGFNAGAGNDSVTGTVGSDLICGGSGNDSILAGLGDDIILGSTGADILSGGSGIDTFLFASGDSGQSIGYDQILDFAKGKKGVGDIIRSNSPMSLQVGGLSSVIDSNHASINQKSGVASFAAGSGKTLSDALNDVANSTDQTGHFAFFKVANAGNYNLFISDGVQGVTSGDVVVQLIGLTSINTINTLEGLRIFD